jgi:hypothetical protein
VTAVVVLRDRFEVDSANAPVRSLGFQPHIRKDEVAVVQRKVQGASYGPMRVFVGHILVASVVERAERQFRPI